MGISLALLIGFVYVYYLSYIKYIDSKKEITETHFSEIVTAGKALVLNHIDNITEETGYTAEILSLAGDSKENDGGDGHGDDAGAEGVVGMASGEFRALGTEALAD